MALFSKPKLSLQIESTGGGTTKLTFTAFASNAARVPARDCLLIAELEGEGIIYRSPPFNLGPLEIGYPISFALERPRYGDLVDRQVTLYGRALTAELRCGKGGATAIFRE